MNTGIGGVTSALKLKAQTPIQVQRFLPSTQTCSRCHSLYRIERKERTYHCERCGLSIDRDHNAARNIEKEGLMTLKELPTEYLMRRKVTTADTSASTREVSEQYSSSESKRCVGNRKPCCGREAHDLQSWVAHDMKRNKSGISRQIHY